MAVAWLAGCGGDESGVRSPSEEALPVVDEAGLVPDLICPGGPGCRHNDGPLIAGAAVRAITPTLEPWSDDDGDGKWSPGEDFEDRDGDGSWDPVWVAGFGNGRAATDVADDVWARALVIEQGDVSLAMVALDLVGLFHTDVIRIRQAAAALGFDHVVVATTHNHEGPDTMGIWGPGVTKTGYDADYVSWLIDETVAALSEAKGSARAARIRYGQAEAPHLVNDIREPIVIDQALTAIQLVGADDGAPIATTVVWGNHAEALGASNTSLTSDFPHYLRDELEQAFPQGPALFFNGSLGGLSTTIGIVGCPDEAGEDTCPQGTFERAAYVGRGAAEAAIDALEEAPIDVEDGQLSLRRNAFLMASTNPKLALAFTFGLLPRTLYDAETSVALDEEEAKAAGAGPILDGSVVLQTELNVIELGPLAIVTVPGELYPELWLESPNGATGGYQERPDGGDFPEAPILPVLMSALPDGRVPLIINNANDAIGYIIPKPQWDEKAPYAYVEEGEGAQYGEENSLGYDTAPRVVEAFDTLMKASP